ncbi:unnamed protein product, partial [Polarella glacialis]
IESMGGHFESRLEDWGSALKSEFHEEAKGGGKVEKRRVDVQLDYDDEFNVAKATFCLAFLLPCFKSTMAMELYLGHAQLTKSVARGLGLTSHFAEAWDDREAANLASEAICGKPLPLYLAPKFRPLLVTFDGEVEESVVSKHLSEFLPEQFSADPVPGLAAQLRKSRERWGQDYETRPTHLVIVEGSPYPMDLCDFKCGRASGSYWHRDDVKDCFSCPEPKQNQSALREICEDLFQDGARLDLVVLDTASPGIEEWFLMEKYCRPRHIIIMNTNMPLHQGWVVQRLLGQPGSTWREILGGMIRWGDFPGILNFIQDTHWRFLADLGD